MILFSSLEFWVPVIAVASIEGEVVELLEKAHYKLKAVRQQKTKSIQQIIILASNANLVSNF